MRFLSPIPLIILLHLGCASPRVELDVTRHQLAIGEDSVAIVVHEAAEDGLTLINVHENETTSIEAALEHVRANGGRVIHLEHSGERNITFSIGDSTFVVDPNRIYTDEGIRATLENLSTYSPDAHDAVRAFSDSLLSVLDLEGLPVVVTVHNNTDENYSILSYAEDGEYAADAQFTYVDAGKDEDDFFFITEADWFSGIRSAGFNVVVQDNAQVTDDGSLSVLCGQRGIPYVNVEAQHGHFEIQVQMLDYLERFLTQEDVLTQAR